jgi:hypothetical protein
MRKEKERIKKKDVKSHASERRLVINRHMGIWRVSSKGRPKNAGREGWVRGGKSIG